MRDSPAQTVKSLPAMWETWVQSLCQEVPLQKEMATHSSILAQKIPWMDESGRFQSVGWQSQDTTETSLQQQNNMSGYVCVWV